MGEPEILVYVMGFVIVLGGGIAWFFAKKK